MQQCPYGHLLTIKALLVVAIIVVASTGKHLVATHLLPSLRSTVRPVQISLDEEARAVRELRDGIWAEVVLAIAVLGVTSSLVFSAPARESELASRNLSARTVRVHGVAAGIRYSLVAQPGLAGVNTLIVTPSLHGTSGRFLPTSLGGSFIGPGSRAARTIHFTPLADGRWVASAVFGSSGTWLMTLTESDGTSSSTVRISVPIG